MSSQLSGGLAPDTAQSFGSNSLSSDFSSVDMSTPQPQGASMPPAVSQLDVENPAGPSGFGGVQTTLTEPVSETLVRRPTIASCSAQHHVCRKNRNRDAADPRRFA